jgi:hypothetical protein
MYPQAPEHAGYCEVCKGTGIAPSPATSRRFPATPRALQELIKHAKAFLHILDIEESGYEAEHDIEENLKQAIVSAEAAPRTATPQPRTPLGELRKELYALSLDPHIHEERKAAYAVVVCRIDEVLAGAIQPRPTYQSRPMDDYENEDS